MMVTVAIGPDQVGAVRRVSARCNCAPSCRPLDEDVAARVKGTL
jgi:hypothetical protein